MNYPLGHRCLVKTVNLRKDSATNADQAVITKAAGPLAFFGDGDRWLPHYLAICHRLSKQSVMG
jgi:hypothetical protein